MSQQAQTETTSLYESEPKIYPRMARGRYARLRVLAMVVLLGLYYLLPWITIGGELISREAFLDAWADIAPFVDAVDTRSVSDGGPRMTYFEVLVALAYTAFADAPVDVAIVGVPFDSGVSYRPGARFGPGHVRARLRKHAPRLANTLTEEIFEALAQQTVVVAGTEAAATVVPILAEQLAGLLQQRARLATQVEAVVEAHPLHPVLISMPGVGIRTAARILTEVVGKDFVDAGHLASYAGIAPVTRRSGTSIRGEHVARGGNKRLKRALFLSAFASLSHPPSRAYYDRKRAQGKRHNQALIALARRRTDVLYAMLRDGTLYQDPTAPPAPSSVALAA